MMEIIILGSSAAAPFPRTDDNRWGDYSDIENYAENFPLHNDLLCDNAKNDAIFPRVFFTHIGHGTLPHEELSRYVKQKYAGADIAYDGMEITLSH